MKPYVFGLITMFVLFVVLFVYLHQVGKQPRHDATGLTRTYLDWLDRSESMAVNPEPGSEEAKRYIERVQNAFTPFSVDNVSENFPKAYAEDLYFRDAFHTYTDLQPMLDYMIKSAEMSPGVTFEFSEPSRNEIDFYLPWTMVLPDKKGGKPQKSVGISRLRFNRDGKVIFHQDYWDSADVLVPKVPVANGLIELVRRRF